MRRGPVDALFRQDWLFLLIAISLVALRLSSPRAREASPPPAGAAKVVSWPSEKAVPSAIVNAGLFVSLSAVLYLISSPGKLLTLKGAPPSELGVLDVLKGALLFIFFLRFSIKEMSFFGETTLAHGFAAQMGCELLALLLMLELARERRKAEGRAAPAGPGGYLRTTAFSALLYVAAIIPIYIAAEAAVWFFKAVGWKEAGRLGEQEAVRLVATETSLAGIALLAVMICVAAPVLEELFFRGFLYRALKRRLGMPLAALVVSLAFVLMHQPPVAWGPLFVLALLLTYAYEKTGSLWSSIVIHALNNAAQMVLIILIR